MRSAVSAVFFLAMVPLGLMATEVQVTGHRTSNVQDTVGSRSAQHVSSNLIVCAATGRMFSSDLRSIHWHAVLLSVYSISLVHKYLPVYSSSIDEDTKCVQIN